MSVQVAIIKHWHPATSANKSHDSWPKTRKAHHADRDMAWASAMQAGWVFVPGKVRLTITLVYPRKYRLDADNLHSKVKGVLDGLKRHEIGLARGERFGKPQGFFTDDSTDWLDLQVRAEVVRGVKETRLELQSE